jgi:glycosyltransferase involved in cell wall biosynthesis
MRIAMLAPLWKTVPPQKYGGTELIASLLADELVDIGHDVTLFACGGSKTKAKLIPIIDRPLYDILGGFKFDAVPFQDIIEVKNAFDMAKNGQFDIIHNHMGFHVAAFGNISPVPIITTNHSSLPPDNEALARAAKDSSYISISNSQRSLAPYLNYIETVYHGIKTQDFSFNNNPDDYLLYLASMSKDKGADIAIEITKKANMKMIMAGDIKDQAYFDLELGPKIDGEQIVFLGEVGTKQKKELMENAKAYVFPIRWSEAFGLTVVEALASGTPVIAFSSGSLPEIIDNGKTGFLVKDIDQAVDAINKIKNISRLECRRQAVERFDVSIMAKNYVKVYESLIK